MSNESHTTDFCKGQIIYHPKWLTPKNSNKYLSQLKQSLPWKSDKIRFMGKQHSIPRLHAWIADSNINYSYSGISLEINPWSTATRELKMLCEQSCQHSFNSMLANYYRNGKDSNGWHADNEKELGQNPLIAIVSFGQVRRLSIRSNDNHKEKLDYDLANGSLIIMKGELQHQTQHCLRKTQKDCAERISLTFRLTNA
ncbi:alpha-ketoglutarate-dependent dioxygenase AlkB [Lentisphaera profundi]|uniref:Alpha-ketoglutarate-dependent dioxygenase AlkB n=1 Tax=Lentisphaera profundi TaxID=1658616 RepID=A0ABY7VZ16_9BACT|nr:alpha-ketoglutarate-dependent dioxygenase AlkB [Lentisphaera profundi]WDE98112.1 alpha-ketoglutarate-dependent dioxygenase AlkB [Lentisphaera profundi]